MKNLNFIFDLLLLPFLLLLLPLFQRNSPSLQQYKGKRNNIKLSFIFSSLFITSSLLFANNPVITISPTEQVITSGTTSVTLDVNLNEGPDQQSIDIAYTDTCSGTTGTLTIPKNGTSGTIDVNTTTLPVSGIPCTVTLNSAEGNGAQGDGNITVDTATITMESEPDISISPTEKIVNTDTNSTELFVTLSEAGNIGDINVSYEHNCSGSNPNDTGTVTVPKGNTTQSFDVNTSGLTSGASCSVTLSNPVGIDSQKVNPTIDPNTSIITALTQTADLSITKTAIVNNSEVNSTRINTEFQYKIDVTNQGPDTATSVVVTDTLPQGIDINITSSNTASGDWNCDKGVGTVTCTHNSSIGSGNTSTITLNVTAPSFEGYITNNVTVHSDNDTDTTNNSASVEIKVVDTNNTWDICYQNSTASSLNANCNQAGILYVANADNKECEASVDIANLDKDNIPTEIRLYKLYEPNVSQGTCDSTDSNIDSCVQLTNIDKPNYTNYSGGYEYNLSIFPDANVTLIDSNTYNTNEDINDSILYAEYIRDGLAYAGKIQSCRSYSRGLTESYVDIVDPDYYQGDSVIQTKVSKKDNQQLHVVHVDPLTFVETDYIAPTFDNAVLQVLLYRSDSTCTDQLALAEPVEGSPAGEPVIAFIPHQSSNALTNSFTMKAIASRDSRIKAKVADWDSILEDLDSSQACFQNSNDSANFNGLPQCLNSLGTNSGISLELLEAYPHILTQCLNQTGGTYSACDSSAYDGDGSKGGIYPPIYDHEYGCLACILDSIGEPGSCSRDNFAIRPDYFEIDATDEDFPNLLRAGEDYNMTVYAYDYGDTNGTDGTLDYNQTGGAGGNIDLNQTRYYKDGTIENNSNILFGDLVWSAWDFDMTHGISNQNGIISPVSATEVAGIQYNDVGKINISVEDREWAAVDINNPDDNTAEDCTSDAAYICGDKNVTYIPHHFGFTELSIANHAGPDTNFTYVADRRGMPTITLTNSLMAANIATLIEALTIDGDITKNFRTGTLYYENNISVTPTVKVPSSGTNSYLYPDANESEIDNKLVGFGRSGLDDNGTRNILWDESTFPLEFNFRRDYDKPNNPFDVNGSYLNISLNSHYVDPEDGDTADINGSRAGDYNTTGWSSCASDDGCIQQNAEDNATFFYGRAHPSQDPYDDVRTFSINTPVLVNVYCNPAYVLCTDYGIYTNAQTNEYDWWLSFEHEMSKGHGNIELSVGTITPSGTATVTNNDSVTINSNAIDENVLVTAGNNTPRPMTVNIDFVTNDALSDYTHPWLIYNSNTNTVPVPFYRVIFVGNADWAGHGDTGNVVDSDASIKKNRRLGW